MNDSHTLRFARTYKPKRPRAAYDWVLAYAQEKIALYERVTDTLDRKAESFMRYVGGIGIALAAALPVVLREDAALVLAFVPALAALLLAAVRSGQSVVPTSYSALPEIRKAFEYTDYFDDDAQTRFYAAAVPMEKELMELIESKATLTNEAFLYLWFALFWLGVSAILAGLLFLGVLPRGLSVFYSVLWSVVGCLAVALIGVFQTVHRKNRAKEQKNP